MKPAVQYALWAAGLAGAGAAAYYVFRNTLPEPESAPIVPPGIVTPPPVNPSTRVGKGYLRNVPEDIQLKDIGNGKQLRTDAADAYIALSNAAAAAGINLVPVSAFRTMDEQQELYDGWKAKKPGYNLAALPGWSNHQGGISVDLNTGGYITATYRWLFANASRFGFKNNVLTEHWHWTYLPSGSANVAGLSGLGTLGTLSALPASPAQWLIPAAAAGLVIYQVYIRKDEGKRTIGVRIPDPKASRLSKQYAKGEL